MSKITKQQERINAPVSVYRSVSLESLYIIHYILSKARLQRRGSEECAKHCDDEADYFRNHFLLLIVHLSFTIYHFFHKKTHRTHLFPCVLILFQYFLAVSYKLLSTTGENLLSVHSSPFIAHMYPLAGWTHLPDELVEHQVVNHPHIDVP